MKKLFIMITAISVLAFTFSACKSEEPVNKEHIDLFADEMPEPFDFPEPSGPEALGDFKRCYNFTFSNLDSTIMSLADKEEISEWLDEKIKEGFSEPYTDNINVLSFAERFDIPKEKLLEAVEGSEYEEGWIVSPEDIEIIYSGDNELINKTFVSEYALAHGEKVYSAEWIYMHTIEGYLNEGLSLDEVTERLTKMEELPFTEEAKSALSDKKAELESLLG